MDDPFQGLEYLFDKYAKTPEPPTKSMCIVCSVELSDTLDAYYGRNEMQRMRCIKCRKPE